MISMGESSARQEGRKKGEGRTGEEKAEGVESKGESRRAEEKAKGAGMGRKKVGGGADFDVSI